MSLMMNERIGKCGQPASDPRYPAGLDLALEGRDEVVRSAGDAIGDSSRIEAIEREPGAQESADRVEQAQLVEADHVRDDISDPLAQEFREIGALGGDERHDVHTVGSMPHRLTPLWTR